ncbi:autotransporter assembly complex family protein [Tropicimonas sp. TH_r6]|uniref:autotransporter assembly complex protein TamA n=1 Tax=Tropicimonas sp. TH_r6 TaxID=3082085 RepID=UPI0029557098|nr:autotransporter assembly complex family protein [Tropicimonas sp. TH_r6]MDV7142684.1 autotransporter assembly complex family protein [Tropicimonas sp. TH_r6]
MKSTYPIMSCLGAAALTALFAQPVCALDSVTVTAPGAEEALAAKLESASMILQAQEEERTTPEELLGTARAEYKRMISVLYGEGYYSGVISVRIDGREAADISPLSPPKAISNISVTVEPGPQFRFSEATVAPLAPETELPEGYATGEIAQSGLIGKAASTAVSSWRDDGHAKAELTGEDITANHPSSTIASRLTVDPGPKLRFGPMTIRGNKRMRTERIVAIAGLPEGETFSPEELNDAAERLRRSGAFRSISMKEADQVGPGDQLAIETDVLEEKRRRFGFGLEFSSQEGGRVNAYWMHRNLLGGAENLRFDLDIENLGTTADDNGVDYYLSGVFRRPATFHPDVDALLRAKIEHEDEPGYISTLAEVGGAFAWHYSDELELRAGLDYRISEVEDAFGDRQYQLVSFPFEIDWDKRDNEFDATRGFFLGAEMRPFVGVDNMDNGVLSELDLRGYLGFGAKRNTVLAGWLQLGSLYGPEISGAPADYLFFAGGGGSVRGQPYQSLGAGEYDDTIIGGRSYVASSAELRSYVAGNLGVVGFVDAGYVGAEEFYDGSGSWMYGAGLGVRYKTGFGPIRVDIATPVEGGPDDAEKVQLYIGIGQAF